MPLTVHRRQPHPQHVDARGLGTLGVLTAGAQPHTDPRPEHQVPDHGHAQVGHVGHPVLVGQHADARNGRQAGNALRDRAARDRHGLQPAAPYQDVEQIAGGAQGQDVEGDSHDHLVTPQPDGDPAQQQPEGGAEQQREPETGQLPAEGGRSPRGHPGPEQHQPLESDVEHARALGDHTPEGCEQQRHAGHHGGVQDVTHAPMPRPISGRSRWTGTPPHGNDYDRRPPPPLPAVPVRPDRGRSGVWHPVPERWLPAIDDSGGGSRWPFILSGVAAGCIVPRRGNRV